MLASQLSAVRREGISGGGQRADVAQLHLRTRVARPNLGGTLRWTRQFSSLSTNLEFKY